MFLGACIS